MRYNSRSVIKTVEGDLVTTALRVCAGVLFSVSVWAVPHLALGADQQKSDGALTSDDQAQSADEWPQFRGPTGDGISSATNVPVTWSTNQNLKWKVSVPGRGRSSPVLLGNRIWLTTAFETNVRTFSAGPDRMQQAERVEIGVVCLDRATGKQVYYQELFSVDNPPAVNVFNSYATPTPVAKAGRLLLRFRHLWHRLLRCRLRGSALETPASLGAFPGTRQLARSLQEPSHPGARRWGSAVYYSPQYTDWPNRLEKRPAPAQHHSSGVPEIVFHAVRIRSCRQGANGCARGAVVRLV